MTDWIEHPGGPQPVADDVWVEVMWPTHEGRYNLQSRDEIETADDIPWEGTRFRYRVLNQHLIDAARLEGLKKGLEAFDEARLAVEADIAKLCDAARLEGIRLGLKAAAEVSDAVWQMGVRPGATILSLKPETIAKETAR
jgi:hypothetical protein